MTLSKLRFSQKDNLKKCTSFEEQRNKVYSRKRLFWHFHLQLSFVYKTVSQIYFNLFCSEDKRDLSEFLGNKIDFTNIMNVNPNVLAKNWKFKNLRHGFVDERAMITITLIPSCHWKTLACKRKDLKTYF